VFSFVVEWPIIFQIWAPKGLQGGATLERKFPSRSWECFVCLFCVSLCTLCNLIFLSFLPFEAKSERTNPSNFTYTKSLGCPYLKNYGPFNNKRKHSNSNKGCAFNLRLLADNFRGGYHISWGQACLWAAEKMHLKYLSR
jgi:hypothetical protein